MEKIDNKDIRPYTDEEINRAMLRITSNPHFPLLAHLVFPNIPVEQTIDKFRHINSVDEFQGVAMHNFVKNVLQETADAFIVKGIDHIIPSEHYLFISNHRDIVLDTAVLQMVLFDNSIPTSEITIGNNLLASDFFKDLVKSNKMITSIRGCSIRECLNNSIRLSSVIRENIEEDNNSVWISQRNGRSKDGDDKTEIGLLKMLNLSGKGDMMDNFNNMHILPVSISYQIEPCDFLKTKELYIKRRQQYCKSKDEDYNSILTGIRQSKGKICLSFSKEIQLSNENFGSGDNNSFYRQLATIIDNSIISSYQLWNNNYVAYDIINGVDINNDYYTEDEKSRFIAYMNEGISKIDINANVDELQDIFLHIYANPVINKLNLNKDE